MAGPSAASFDCAAPAVCRKSSNFKTLSDKTASFASLSHKGKIPLSETAPRRLLFPAWRSADGFSDRTGRCILASGEGPVITRVSPKRIGITDQNNARWQRSRERA
jgi:hypothetical protein